MTTTAMTAGVQARLAINSERLWDSLMELAAIGAYDDAETGLTGVSRQALTDADAEGRHLLIKWMEKAGLEVSIDEMGTVFGRREGTESDAEPVMACSHIDSVGTACAFDETIRLMSGVGHDAQKMAAITPSAMIVARGQYEGIRHNPREYSTPEDCAAGITVLANTVLGLAEEVGAA